MFILARFYLVVLQAILLSLKCIKCLFFITSKCSQILNIKKPNILVLHKINT